MAYQPIPEKYKALAKRITVSGGSVYFDGKFIYCDNIVGFPVTKNSAFWGCYGQAGIVAGGKPMHPVLSKAFMPDWFLNWPKLVGISYLIGVGDTVVGACVIDENDEPRFAALTEIENLGLDMTDREIIEHSNIDGKFTLALNQAIVLAQRAN